MKKNVVFDMETGDPDDVFTLCFLTSHPDVNLAGVTITPGTDEQVGVVKHILERTGNQYVAVGSRTPGYAKQCVSAWHYKWLGKVPPQKPDGLASEIMYWAFFDLSESILITGAAVTNPAKMFAEHDTKIAKWVAQGGFAGDNIVPPEHRLEKFAGRITCPTYNFNGDPKAALALLEEKRIKEKYLVSKNVCHGVLYDQEFHRAVEPHKDETPGLGLIYDGMSLYLKKRAKAFHDPLAACVALNPSICEWEQVKMYRERGEWGANQSTDSNTMISVNVNMDEFIKTLTTT